MYSFKKKNNMEGKKVMSSYSIRINYVCMDNVNDFYLIIILSNHK